MKSGNLNFLEPSGPLQACNGTDLPYTKRQRREVLSLSRQTECTRSGSWRRSALDAGEWSTSAFGHITTAREPRCLWNRRLGEPLNILWTILDTNKCISPAGIRYPNNLARSSSLHRPLNVKTCAIYIYMLRSKIENAHWAEKLTTTRCDNRETATTWNFVSWLFLNNHNALWHVKICHEAKVVSWLLNEMTTTSSDFTKISQDIFQPPEGSVSVSSP